LPADLTHLKFIEGGLQEQVRIGALLNTLEIEPLGDISTNTDGQNQ